MAIVDYRISIELGILRYEGSCEDANRCGALNFLMGLSRYRGRLEARSIALAKIGNRDK